jgi:hypothetical protein
MFCLRGAFRNFVRRPVKYLLLCDFFYEMLPCHYAYGRNFLGWNFHFVILNINFFNRRGF